MFHTNTISLFTRFFQIQWLVTKIKLRWRSLASSNAASINTKLKCYFSCSKQADTFVSKVHYHEQENHNQKRKNFHEAWNHNFFLGKIEKKNEKEKGKKNWIISRRWKHDSDTILNFYTGITHDFFISSFETYSLFYTWDFP